MGMEHQLVHAYEVSSIKVGLQDLTGKAHQIEPAYKVAGRGCRISRVGNYRSYTPTRYQEVTSGSHGFEIPDRTRLCQGRYENLAVNQRTCFNCRESVESEKHVLLHCPLYEDLQYEMFYEASQVNPQFDILNDDEKIVYLFSSTNIVKILAKTCKNILDRRRRFLYR